MREIRSMLRRTKVFLLAIALHGLVIACTAETDQSISFKDPFLKAQVVSALRAEQVRYIEEGDTIWFSTRDSALVDKLFREAVQNRPVHYKFTNQKDRQEFVALLRQRGIEPLVTAGEDGEFVVMVKRSDLETAGKAFDSFVQMKKKRD